MTLQRATVKKKKKVISSLCIDGYTPWSLEWYDTKKKNKNAAGNLGLTPGLGKSPGEGNDYSLQYSYLENSMDTGACQLQSVGSQRVGHN